MEYLKKNYKELLALGLITGAWIGSFFLYFNFHQIYN